MFQKALLSLAAICMMAVVSGCNMSNNKFFDHVTFKLADDLETVRVSLVFKPAVHPTFGGEWPVKDYGSLFVNPWTEATPFAVGFDLNTKIVNEQDYVHLAPTDTLPNGLPLGLGYPLVEVRSPQPISSSFDLYGYVDVLHAKWLGVAAMFSFLSDKNFPAAMALSMGFNPDNQGNPAILASVFGPVVDNEGNLVRNGGIVLLANVRQLIGKGEFQPGHEYIYYPEKKFHKGGPGVLLK